ncbi:unnamed protein product [Penicillium bialowiezense]
MAPMIEKVWGLTSQWTPNTQGAYRDFDEWTLIVIVSLILLLAVMCVMTPFYFWRRSHMGHPEDKTSVRKVEEESEYPGVKEAESDGWINFVYLFHAALTL